MIQKNNLFDLKGKVAVITGGSGLLGIEYAEALVNHGAHVILADINEARLSDAAKALDGKGIKIEIFKGDVSKKDSWKKLIDHTVANHSRLDVLVNNAAYTNQSKSSSYETSFLEYPEEDWDALMNVNLKGMFLGCQLAGAQMLKQGSGSIINISSLYGVVSPHHRIYPGTGIFQPVAYAVSKSGVLGLTKYLAALWAEKGIRVNSITPGGVFNHQNPTFVEKYSALSPTGTMLDKSDLSGAVVFLASDASRQCIGHNLVIDGGWTTW
jgi:NAD(P)-dependent dehydrogenase (short-subunit alcohol dehydrogenase family)